MVDDARTLGVKHATFNFNLSQLIDPNGDTNNPSWELGDRVYHFQRGYVESMDRRIKTLSDEGVLVYLIVLAYQAGPEVTRVMLHPDYSPEAPNRLGAFNTATDEGRGWFAACLQFMAHRWSRETGTPTEHGRVVGYILGNEVNSHWWWSNMGRVAMETFADDYLRTARLTHAAVRRHSSWARIYLSLEHHWNIRFPAGDETQCFPGRPFLEYFARQARAGGDFDWHLAFHPYPENLFDPEFWKDETATMEPDTPRVTFKNLRVLTEFMRRPEMLHGGEPRRIIFSEQGFHTPEGPEGETIQAAAYCYAYKKIEALDGVDAFILHRHVDHPHEGGLLLGLRGMYPAGGEDRPRKKIYECFRLADTPRWEEAFQFALPIVGLEEWESH